MAGNTSQRMILRPCWSDVRELLEKETGSNCHDQKFHWWRMAYNTSSQMLWCLKRISHRVRWCSSCPLLYERDAQARCILKNCDMLTLVAVSTSTHHIYICMEEWCMHASLNWSLQVMLYFFGRIIAATLGAEHAELRFSWHGRAIFCRHRISGCATNDIGSTSCFTFLLSTMTCVMYTLLPKDFLALCLSNQKQKRDTTVRFPWKARQSTSHLRWETARIQFPPNHVG